MTEIITGMTIGLISMATGVVLGFKLCMYSFRKGASVVDRIYQDKAPFDEKMIDEEPLDSHVDGINLDE